MSHKKLKSETTAFFALRSRDLFWTMTLAIIVNLAAITLFSIGYNSMKMPMLTMVALIGLLAIFFSVDIADDFAAAIEGLDEDEKASPVGQRLLKTPMIMFKITFVIVFGGMAGTILYSAF